MVRSNCLEGGWEASVGSLHGRSSCLEILWITWRIVVRSGMVEDFTYLKSSSEVKYSKDEDKKLIKSKLSLELFSPGSSMRLFFPFVLFISSLTSKPFISNRGVSFSDTPECRFWTPIVSFSDTPECRFWTPIVSFSDTRWTPSTFSRFSGRNGAQLASPGFRIIVSQESLSSLMCWTVGSSASHWMWNCSISFLFMIRRVGRPNP